MSSSQIPAVIPTPEDLWVEKALATAPPLTQEQRTQARRATASCPDLPGGELMRADDALKYAAAQLKETGSWGRLRGDERPEDPGDPRSRGSGGVVMTQRRPDPDRSCPTCQSWDPYLSMNGGKGDCPDQFDDIAWIAIMEAKLNGTEVDLDSIPVCLKDVDQRSLTAIASASTS
jgi:hypothetical protein